ncbi:MAG: stability protein StbD [Pasteurellaceae bacterium]|nr:stability protein StbD [Pasteurellaceae bacterium]
MAIHQVLTSTVASITDLKRNPMGTVASATENSGAVAILNRNEPAFYCVTPDMFELFCELMDDVELGKLALKRKAERDVVAVNIDEL